MLHSASLTDFVCLFVFFHSRLLSFGLSTVIQNVTHRASTKSPDKTPYGGTIVGESVLKSTSTLSKSDFADNKVVEEFALWPVKLMLVHFLSILFSILACVHSRLGSRSVNGNNSRLYLLAPLLPAYLLKL